MPFIDKSEFFTCLLKACKIYQGNQWQLPETLWLPDRLDDYSMHQSLIQEITSASAIRNASSRKEEEEDEKKETLWLQHCEIKKIPHWGHSCGEFPAGTKAPTMCDRKKISHCVTSLLKTVQWHIQIRAKQQDVISLTKRFSPLV